MSECKLIQGDCINVMRGMEAQSVHCVVTSPPYWGLRDYGTDDQLGAEPLHDCLSWARGDEPCGACFVCNLRSVFAEVWRVLRDDGCVWLNLGDSYNGSGGAGGDYGVGGLKEGQPRYPGRNANGLKPKDLCGMPWRTALALQADGWYLRSDAIWAKKNCMPESVTDRPTKAHEYVFLLTKSQKYFWDAEAIKEPSVYPDDNRKARQSQDVYDGVTVNGKQVRSAINPSNPKTYPTRNIRSVFHLASTPYKSAHFATMPPALAEICVKSGSSEHGVCAECGGPWERVVEKTMPALRTVKTNGPVGGHGLFGGNRFDDPIETTTTGWQPTCTCNAAIIPATVLDPFNGSGTTGAVACSLGRDYVGIDLNADYIALAHTRIKRAIRDSGRKYVQPDCAANDYEDTPLFA